MKISDEKIFQIIQEVMDYPLYRHTVSDYIKEAERRGLVYRENPHEDINQTITPYIGKADRILSIDWDYFFPNLDEINFHANESFTYCYENRWAFYMELKKLKPFIPRNFWDFCKKNKQIPIFISSTHSTIWQLLFNQKNCVVDSYDAHHDCGYISEENLNRTNLVTCCSWGYYGLQHSLKEINVHYPWWRKEYPEENKGTANFRVKYCSPETIPTESYDAIFITRSDVFTPPWSDALFQKFIQEPSLNIKYLDSRSNSIRNTPKKD